MAIVASGPVMSTLASVTWLPVECQPRPAAVPASIVMSLTVSQSASVCSSVSVTASSRAARIVTGSLSPAFVVVISWAP